MLDQHRSKVSCTVSIRVSKIMTKRVTEVLKPCTIELGGGNLATVRVHTKGPLIA